MFVLKESTAKTIKYKSFEELKDLSWFKRQDGGIFLKKDRNVTYQIDKTGFIDYGYKIFDNYTKDLEEIDVEVVWMSKE